MTTFKQFLIEQDREIIDNKDGLGQVPLNQDIEYFGLRVQMRPSTFLQLAKTINPDDEKVQYIVQHLQQDGAVGAPFLQIQVPEHWIQSGPEKGDIDFARVHDHDGRHRMYAIKQVFGDQPVETHLTFTGPVRSRHITSEWIQQLNSGMISQNGKFVNGPLFTVKQ